MNKNILPVIAALCIALLVVPLIPVQAATPVTGYSKLEVVTIPQDDQMRNTGIMVLDLAPTEYDLSLSSGDYSLAGGNWYRESTCANLITTETLVGPQWNDEPLYPIDLLAGLHDDAFDAGDIPWPAVLTFYHKVSAILCEGPFYFEPLWPQAKGYNPGLDLLSQHKLMVTLDGVPTTPTYFKCEIVEKEKAKIPPWNTKTPTKRQFPDEDVKTTLIDITNYFWCKPRWAKPGVGVLDVYFVGPRTRAFIADHMLIVTVGLKVGTKTLWASDLQDICILGWAMDDQTIGIWKFWAPCLSEFPPHSEWYWSFPDALGHFVGCEEAAIWQGAWIVGGWPWGTN